MDDGQVAILVALIAMIPGALSFAWQFISDHKRRTVIAAEAKSKESEAKKKEAEIDELMTRAFVSLVDPMTNRIAKMDERIQAQEKRIKTLSSAIKRLNVAMKALIDGISLLVNQVYSLGGEPVFVISDELMEEINKNLSRELD